MIVAFHPALKLERIIIYRSYAHPLEQLTTLHNFSREQISFIELHLINMLRDAAFDVSKRKCKCSVGHMFSIESAMVKKTLLKWFNAKIRRQFEKINPLDKLSFERSCPINWKKDKCVICKFPIKIEPTNYLTPDNEMAFGDFVIRYEQKIVRNIYTTEQIERSDHIKNLQCYYEIFQEYIQICIGLLALLNSFDRHDCINFATQEFVENEFAGDDISDIKNTINQTEIKNILSMTKRNVSKFNLKVYAYVYDQLFAFPRSDIDYEIIISNKFFLNVHRLIRGKYHLHLSHITGKIVGYAHDFCNSTVVKKSTSEIPFIAHNFFGFSLF